MTAFQRLAEIVGQYCKKGSKVGIWGQLQYHQWQDKEGVNHNNIVEILAKELELLGGNNGNSATADEDVPAGAEDDDVPF